MDTMTVPIELPRDLLGLLDVPSEHLETRLRELIALELFREGRISSGKGAEMLEMSKLAFVRLLFQHGIPYFTETVEELKVEVAQVEQIFGENDI
jgi:predicted HTH domain antitoxin